MLQKRFHVSSCCTSTKASMRSLAFASLMLAGVGRCLASEEADQTSEPAFTLGRVVVSGEKTELSEATTYGVDATKISLLEEKDLSSALSTVPGVSLTRFGGRNDASVYVRGFSRNQVPLFIDGIPVYVPYDGTIDMGRFTTYDVAEIDVSKGFSSTLYGPNTMGGAINLITRRPTRAYEGMLEAGVTNGRGREASINAGTKQKHIYAQLGLSYRTQDYYELSSGFVKTTNENGGARENSDFKDRKLSAKLGWTPENGDEHAIGYILQSGLKGNPSVTTGTPSYWRWPMWNKETLYYVSTIGLAQGTSLKPRVYFDKYDNSLSIYDDATYSTENSFNYTKNSGSGTSIYNDHSWGGILEADSSTLARQTLKAAVQYKDDYHKERPDVLHRQGTTFIDEDESWSFDAEDTIKLAPSLELLAGASLDSHSSVKSVDSSTGLAYPKANSNTFNPQGALFYKATDAVLLRLTVSRKSRFPTMKERYSYRMPDSKGNPQGMPNPALKVEKATHYEVGATLGKEQWHLSPSLFYSRIQDTITSVVVKAASGSIPAVSQFQNVGTSEKYGAELGLDYKPCECLGLGVSLGALQQNTLTILPSYTAPVRVTSVPGRTASAFAEIKLNKYISLVPSIRSYSWFYSTSDGKGNDVTLPGFSVTDIKIEVNLRKDLKLAAGYTNVFDKNYQLVAGYPEAGRGCFANLRYSF